MRDIILDLPGKVNQEWFSRHPWPGETKIKEKMVCQKKRRPQKGYRCLIHL